MPLVNNDDVVQALAANTTDDSLYETILPRTPRRSSNLLDAHSFHSCGEVIPIDTVAISNQISWRIVVGKRFNDLLRRPHCGGVFGDTEVQDSTAAVGENHEDIKYS